MLTKLTLTIDDAVVERAKAYAHKKNRSVSRIVEEYLENITTNQDSGIGIKNLQAPITYSISGMFPDDGKPYRAMRDEALQEKYS